MTGFMTGNYYRKNILYNTARPNTRLYYIANFDRDAFAECDFNLYFGNGDYYAEDGGFTPDDLDSFAKSAKPTFTMEKWKKRDFDCNSIFADPMFIDIDNLNLNFKAGSPATKLGIEPIDISKIGIR